jgi:hypothetical protein
MKKYFTTATRRARRETKAKTSAAEKNTMPLHFAVAAVSPWL